MSVERVLELVRHLTERDREIALCLYEQQVLTTDQLTLLFFSSRRRAQDRLLFLYREQVLDRFYPPSRFGAGKPQAHWLLDEAGALLVATILGVERKRLGWQRRDDWASHPQLAHRLGTNRFVTDLVAATLRDPALGVTAWLSTRDAAERLRADVRPDAGLIIDCPAGPIECCLEWDRGSETQERLQEKLRRYRIAERGLRYHEPEPRNVLFVVPGGGRIGTLRRALHQVSETQRERDRRDPYSVPFEPNWPLLATTVSQLRQSGLLGRVWQQIDRDGEPPHALVELPPRRGLGRADLDLALGRRWRHDQPDFWERLSPLGRPLATTGGRIAETKAAAWGVEPAEVPAVDGLAERLRRNREASLDEARQDLAAAETQVHRGARTADLRLSGVNGLMPDPGDDLDAEEASWR